MPDLSSAPGSDELGPAVELVEESLTGFEFTDGVSRAHAIAMLLTLCARTIIEGPVPLFIISAAKQGSGKSTLAAVAWALTSAEPMRVRQWRWAEEELVKELFAAVNGGSPLNVFDNVSTQLRSVAFAGLLTAGGMQGRVLGHNDREMKCIDRSMWVVTGNNVSVDSDFVRRSALIQLATSTSRPESRSFDTPDIVGHASENRPEIHWALLTILANWFARGRPDPSYVSDDDYPMNGQYRDWIATVGGAIEAAGFRDLEPLLSNRDILEESNEEGANDERMLRGLREVMGDEEFSFEDLMSKLALGSETEERKTLEGAFPSRIRDDLKAGRVAQLERYLRQKRGAPFGDDNIRLKTRRDKMKRLIYRVIAD